MPACRRRAPTSGWSCGCRTAMPRRSRRAVIALDRMGAGQPRPLDRTVGPFATVAWTSARAARAALAGADRDARRPPCCPPALRGDPGRPHPHRPRERRARGSASRLRHPAPAARSWAAATCCRSRCWTRSRFRTHRAAQPDGDSPDDPAAAARRVRPRTDASWPSASSAACRATTMSRWTCPIFGAAEGHGELVYDFREGGDADGWMHALFRYEDRPPATSRNRASARTSSTPLMTYRDEPQSYHGPPPGLIDPAVPEAGRRRSGVALRR